MALRTPDDFIQSIADLDLEIYLFGEKVDDYVNHPMIRPSLNCIAMTYELAAKPEYEDLMTATSHLTGKKVNRFTHIHQSVDDLVKKVKMQRLLGQKTGSCFQRCVGMDAINALWLGHLRDRPGQGHRLPRALPRLRAVPAGRRPRRRRRHDRRQGRPRAGALAAGRPRPLPAHRRAPRRRHRRARRQGPPDRRLQLARDPRHADGRHARGRRGLRRLVLDAGQRARHLLRLRPPVAATRASSRRTTSTSATRASAARRP